jgi:hypothetical protein
VRRSMAAQECGMARPIAAPPQPAIYSGRGSP